MKNVLIALGIYFGGMVIMFLAVQMSILMWGIEMSKDGAACCCAFSVLVPLFGVVAYFGHRSINNIGR
jgi:hypothetical protein